MLIHIASCPFLYLCILPLALSYYLSISFAFVRAFRTTFSTAYHLKKRRYHLSSHASHCVAPHRNEWHRLNLQGDERCCRGRRRYKSPASRSYFNNGRRMDIMCQHSFLHLHQCLGYSSRLSTHARPRSYICQLGARRVARQRAYDGKSKYTTPARPISAGISASRTIIAKYASHMAARTTYGRAR